MTAYRVQFVLHTADSNPENYATNTWCVAGTSDADALEFVTALRAFYATMKGYYSSLVAQNGHEIKVYDLSDPLPRAPISEQVFNFSTVPSGAPLPTEVAICLSFQGPKISGVPQARRRGRVYIGPLNTNALHTDGRPVAALVTALSTAGDVLLDAGGAPLTWDWSVFSPTSGTSVIVTNGWVDNEFDTQRRRGRKATGRTPFS
jgi:hypothetical protein